MDSLSLLQGIFQTQESNWGPPHCRQILYQLSYQPVGMVPFQSSFPGGSDGGESACNAGDPGSVPGLGTDPGDGNGNPLQYSCLENSMDCPWGRKESDMTEWLSLPNGEGNGNQFQYSCLGNPMDRATWQTTAHGVAKIWHDLTTNTRNLPEELIPGCSGLGPYRHPLLCLL